MRAGRLHQEYLGFHKILSAKTCHRKFKSLKGNYKVTWRKQFESVWKWEAEDSCHAWAWAGLELVGFQGHRQLPWPVPGTGVGVGQSPGLGALSVLEICSLLTGFFRQIRFMCKLSSSLWLLLQEEEPWDVTGSGQESPNKRDGQGAHLHPVRRRQVERSSRLLGSSVAKNCALQSKIKVSIVNGSKLLPFPAQLPRERGAGRRRSPPRWHLCLLGQARNGSLGLGAVPRGFCGGTWTKREGRWLWAQGLRGDVWGARGSVQQRLLRFGRGQPRQAVPAQW